MPPLVSAEEIPLHLREAASLLAALRRLAGAAMAQAVAGRTPDPARAVTVAESAPLLVAARRNPAASPSLPISSQQPDDEIRAALSSVTDAVRQRTASPFESRSGGASMSGIVPSSWRSFKFQ